MDRRGYASRASALLVATLVLTLSLSESALADPGGRKPPKPSATPTPTPVTSGPTAPTDLRITGLTSYSVGLAWTAATSSVGIQAYLICCAGNNSERTPGDATSWTFRSGIVPNQTFTLYVGALDNNNRNSQNSPFVTFTTPADATPPSKPTVQITALGDKWVTLAWSSADESGGPVSFTVSRDGTAVLSNSPRTSASFGGLQPQTTYTFAVEARDYAGFRVPSDPLTFTTAAPITDVTPPTPPGLYTNLWMPDGETWLTWVKSTDNVTPQELIVYCIYVNGVLENCQQDHNQSVVYGVPMSRNRYTVTATDRYGNTSETSIDIDNF